jgi:ATP-dependent Clp protease adaptor protein ClpS
LIKFPEPVIPAVREIKVKDSMIADTDNETKTDEAVSLIPPWNVVLLNDDDHSYDYVIEMLMAVFGFPPHKGYQHAKEVDSSGRAILITTSREHAELKQEQVHDFGPDYRVPRCAGSMTCIIEPAS